MTPNNENNNWLSSFEKNIYSQSGEDGILGKIFEILKDGDHWCVEFGAWDGKVKSNTHNLIKNKGWRGVSIESNLKRYRELLNTYSDNDRVICLNKFVNFEGIDVLDNILKESPIPKDFDLLSIDIDGNDYHIWDSLKIYKPKVIVIEFNQSIPNDISFIQEKNMKLNHGSSLLSFYDLSKEKGYELIATTYMNAFFVKKEFFNLFGIVDNSPEEIFKGKKYLTQVFQLLDGTIVARGFDRLMLHDVKMDLEKANPLPKCFRVFVPKMSPTRKLLFKIWKKIFHE